MIATSPSLDVLRHGWLDAAAALAPEVPAIAELLDQRLEDVVRTQRLSEEDLLATIAEVEAAAAAAGTPAAAALTMRLRRTVYEFLLAVDATSAVELAAAAEPILPAAPVTVEPPGDLATAVAEGAPEALPEGSSGEAGTSDPDEGAMAEAAQEPAPQTAEDDPSIEAEGDVTAVASAAADLAEATEDEAEATEPPHAGLTGTATDEAAWIAEVDLDVDEVAPATAPGLDGSSTTESLTEFSETFLAPRAGFHITDEGARTAAPGVPATFALDATAPSQPADTVLEGAQPTADQASLWRVRPSPGGAHREVTRSDHAPQFGEDSDDPFDLGSRLFEERRRIEDRLRRKKCDEAAAMLQALAQETGGRAVAELGMDAGDRCRGLGKTNAALNCYLAAARADPIFEGPLHRLADICIDDQDVDLAVSYLERIARLHQLRGDHTGALRVYRRIVTVAPYREDILTMLMNARNNGQLPS
ncbi:MAG: hypothetical protein ACYDAC_07780 [Candidatus Dormibacteria bacterium]